MRHLRSMVLVMLAVASAAKGASGQLLQHNRVANLIGIRDVSLWISASDSGPGPVTNERLRVVAEQAIRAAGLQVIPVSVQASADLSAFIEVSVVLADIRSTTQKFGYAFWTAVTLRAGNNTVLWERGLLSICEVADGQRAIEAAAGQLLEALLTDWRKANPKT